MTTEHYTLTNKGRAAAILLGMSENITADGASRLIDALTAHIMNEVRTCKQDLQVAPPPVERMSDRRFKSLGGKAWIYWRGQELHDIYKEAARAREAEGWLHGVLQSNSSDLRDASDRIAALEFGRDSSDRIAALEFGLDAISERDGLKVAHKVYSDAIDHCNCLIDRKDTRIAQLGRQLATARGLLERWLIYNTVRYSATANDTRAFLAGKEATMVDPVRVAHFQKIERELAETKQKLATARGLVKRWVEISSHAGCGDECRMSLCVKTRAFLAAQEDGK